LLAEDNKVNIMVAQSMLKRLGYSLEVVGNGADVIQALKQSTYDLILMVSFFVH
jgi:CheY-like chemotaxis protein